jgi:signal peptidase I
MSEPETQNQTPTLESPRKVSMFGAFGLFLFDFVKVFIVALAVIIPIRYFLFQPFVVTGDSMRPNFEDGNYLIVDEITYHFRQPQRGEVVVMRFPNDPSQFFIKRIIALPKERVVIENGHVTIYSPDNSQGMVLGEKYLPNNNLTYGNTDRTLGEDDFFVLGDNRLSSSDSRIWGPLPRQYIVGRVYLRLFPVKSFHLFTAPEFSQTLSRYAF